MRRILDTGQASFPSALCVDDVRGNKSERNHRQAPTIIVTAPRLADA